MFYVFSFPVGVYVGTLNLIASIPVPSILTSLVTAIKPPEGNNWVISLEDVAKDSNLPYERYNRPQNQIRQRGPVCTKLCEIYDITPHKTFNAFSIYNEMHDPDCS